MKIGSIVETVTDFDHLSFWNINYPKKGDILTISDIFEHHNHYCNVLGIVLLKFVERPDLVPLCDKTIHGKYNFKEILPPISNEEKEELNQLANVKLENYVW